MKNSKGVRKLRIKDQLPKCEILINKPAYNIEELVKDKKVIDIGCGYGTNRALVEAVNGTWVGVEPFEGGAHTVVGNAESLPFDDCSFDVAIMDAVLEHIPNVGKAFSEVARVLKPEGWLIGYSAFMECFHEISYSHLSFKALEHYSSINGLKLERISGGGSFGIDYHFRILMRPVPFGFVSLLLAKLIRLLIRSKANLAKFLLQWHRKMSSHEASDLAEQYYQLECLRQSIGFEFLIRKF
jgi:SAM-dependent methyltransferase